MNLDRMTHNELDAVAATRAVTPYPAAGTKAEKAGAIRAALPLRGTAVANAPLSGWRVGEVREVTVDDRLVRRAANGLVTILTTEVDDEPAEQPQGGAPEPVSAEEPGGEAPYPSDRSAALRTDLGA